MKHTSIGHVTHCGWPADTPTDHRRDPKWLSHTVELEDGQAFLCAGPAEPGTEVRFTVDYPPFDEPPEGPSIDAVLWGLAGEQQTFSASEAMLLIATRWPGDQPDRDTVVAAIKKLETDGKLTSTGNGRWRAV